MSIFDLNSILWNLTFLAPLQMNAANNTTQGKYDKRGRKANDVHN